MTPHSVSVTYAQDADSCADDQSDQLLTISTDDAGAGAYLVLSTARWAIDADGIDAFVDELRRVLALVDGKPGGAPAMPLDGRMSDFLGPVAPTLAGDSENALEGRR